ncbi:major capsid protein [Curvibacter lanceolatus]|uniref:major capsid protein n=1 Tax=Curvibacter lanceolatus TaxID=86182 RepID=UPI002357A954|nr:major capsid protein [Curvibacter lanceolatus]
MPQMTTGQARVVDSVLSTVAQGYKNADMVGGLLFPYVPVTQRGGKIIAFGREDFALYATGRAPGAATKRVQFGYAAGSYALESHSLEGLLPFENMQEAAAGPGVDLGALTVAKTQAIIALRLEKAQADLATNAANYAASNKTTLAGTSQWSDYSGVSDPINDVEVGKEAVRKQIGRRPNTGVMGPAVLAKLKQHPKILDRIKYTGRDVPTLELLASLFGLQRLACGEAVYDTSPGGAAPAFGDVWGKSLVLSYTETGSQADQGLPTYGYTYRLGGYPIVEQPYPDRNAKSWVYPVTDEVAPVIAGASAGYLISGAVA